MTGDLAWAIRPKWHRFESPRSYTTRQCEAAGIPLSFAERGLTTPTQPNLPRVWVDEAAAAAIVEAAAGRPTGHYARLKEHAQPNPEAHYPERFLCRLCAGGERVEQIPHDRENWCLRHPGQMVWAGPNVPPESQIVLPYDREQAHAEQRFRRMVSAGRVSAPLHARAWEMVRDNATLTRRTDQSELQAHSAEDREILGRASLYPTTVAILEILANSTTVERWRTLPAGLLRDGILDDLPPTGGPMDVLVERIVLWLRPIRRETRRTRIASVNPPIDVVDAAAIIDVTAPYPSWIQRHPAAIAEWAWGLNDPARDPWNANGISKKAWWACDDGHLWETSPSTRGLATTRCPYCAGQRVWPGHTDLGTTHPDIAAEWDKAPGRNPGDADHVGANSTRRINWRCRYGHRWEAPIRHRVTHGRGCPYCSGHRVLPGSGDLATLRPDIAAQWDAARNGDLTPDTVSPGSDMKVWWTGPCSHGWQATISDRTRDNGTGCPYCANRAVLPGFNDLGTTHPTLAAQWHPSNSKTPRQVASGSSYRARWGCRLGHDWEAQVSTRARTDCACPYCKNRRVLPGFNDLATLNPKLAAEWNSTPGVNDKTASEVTVGSSYRAGWKCGRGHTWSAIVASRNRGYDCPYCAGRKVVLGEADLATLRPDLAAEWDADNTLKPSQVTCSSNRKVAWRCADEHLWHATVANRSNGSGCPFCTGQRAIPGETDLATLRPDLAAEWGPGNTRTPDQFTQFSNQKVAWRCASNHVWQAIIANRSKGTGCPNCARELRPPSETASALIDPGVG